jgi:hypothetical protein
VVRRRSHAQPQFLSILSRHYEALHYVLFFPQGEIGWGLSEVDGVPNLSQVNWYRSRLLANDGGRFTLFGRLCCEYLVDMYSRTEEERLSYISCERRFHNDELRDMHDEDVEFHPDIKLPSSFVGSHAWTSEQAADAMALGRKFGKPYFFCSMTFIAVCKYNDSCQKKKSHEGFTYRVNIIGCTAPQRLSASVQESGRLHSLAHGYTTLFTVLTGTPSLTRGLLNHSHA